MRTEDEDVCGHCGTYQEYRAQYKKKEKKSGTVGMGVLYIVERDKQTFVMNLFFEFVASRKNQT